MVLNYGCAADFTAPLVLPGCSSGAGTTPTESISEEHLETIVSMGFSRDQATKALRATVRTLKVLVSEAVHKPLSRTFKMCL